MGTPAASSRLEKLFDPRASVVALEGVGDPKTLAPAERACTTGFGTTRLAEYAAGRACARIALRNFGIEAFALVTERDRRPRWPSGIVGSITHTSLSCATVVARTDAYAAVGIDVERRGRVGRELWSELFVESERACLARTYDEADVLATLFFSAKEAFYKCRYPLTKSWLDFKDVSIEISPPGEAGIGTFVARLVVPDRYERLSELHGRYAVDSDVVWTGIGIVAQP